MLPLMAVALKDYISLASQALIVGGTALTLGRLLWKKIEGRMDRTDNGLLKKLDDMEKARIADREEVRAERHADREEMRALQSKLTDLTIQVSEQRGATNTLTAIFAGRPMPAEIKVVGGSPP